MSTNSGKPAYVFNVPGNGKYALKALLTVGDRVPLLEGEFGDFTASETQTYGVAGIPDGLGQVEINGLHYVWVNHEIGNAATDVQTADGNGKITGA
ncbi:MAG TPA: hypothetical protein V6C65_41910, partial [Allocoleopsis sp.]